MKVQIEDSWEKHLKREFEKPYFCELKEFVRKAYQTTTCYPPGPKIFNSFNLCPFDKVKVVIIGQDPYHEPSQAEGLCFSVSDGVRIPPSLQNIYKEIEMDIGRHAPKSGSLVRWAEQGVLLLNATLTVEAHKAASHQRKGWEIFTDAVIAALAKERKGIVYILWGSYAQRKGAFIDSKDNLVLKSAHPSPLSVYRGFYGNHHFSKTNDYLVAQGKKPIVW